MLRFQTLALFIVSLAISTLTMAQNELKYDHTSKDLVVTKLDASWTFTQTDSTAWHPATIPGCVHTDLISNGLIEDPFVGINESKCQWVGTKNWTYETHEFEMDPKVLNHDIVRMKFNGLDTYAKVTLNGHVILKSDNAFRSYEIDVKSILKKKNNVLRIDFLSPLSVGKERLATLPYTLPGEPLRAISRKPQFHFGWDWGPKLITCGISKPIEIIAYSRAKFNDVYIRQDKVSESAAKLTAIFDIHSNIADVCSLFCELPSTGEYWSTHVVMKKGLNRVELPFEMPWPKRWWANGVGDANLYKFNCILTKGEKTLDFKEVRVGLRSLELVNKSDSIGESFQFELNGQPVFAKGANYIPITFFPGQAKEEDYRKLLAKCKDAHFNMLRVWGGGVYEDDLFYNLCDEMGIMVWQDFMFACSMYPADSTFVVSVIDEAEEQTVRLRNHPCIALWCGNNENAEAWERWGWQQGLDDSQKSKIWRAYKDIFDLTLKPIVARNTNTPYWESSPRYGRADKRSFTEGDSHYWGLWHDAEPFEMLKEKIPRFMSEFGFQAFPSTEVLKEMRTNNSKLDFNDPGFAQHQKHPRGFKLMDEYMKRWYKGVSTDSLEFYGYMSQVVQAEGMGMGIEAQRRNMNRCMGTLYWQLNDVWPSFSWSSIDYKGNDKLFFSALRKLYEPQLISTVIENDKLNIYWISDTYDKAQALNLRFAIYDEEGKTIVQDQAELVVLEHGASVIYSKAVKSLLGKQDLENKFIRVELFSPETDVPKYERSQKLVMASSEFIVQGKTIARNYDDTIRRKKVVLRDTTILKAKSQQQLNK